ncbi:MAG: hypothetical protein IMZ50_02165 [Candidatus Atribacteria bacterium]|nr:hypothetical protein [Candidatus Atribacteria bacterium]
MAMTLEELFAKVPPEFRPVVEEYGPALVAMTTAEALAWIMICFKGRVDEAYRVLLEKIPSSELSLEWAKLNDEWKTANIGEAARRALMREAGAGVLLILLRAALAMVGLPL